jgi:hypothetical protein
VAALVSWFDAAKRIQVREVAEGLGLTVRRKFGVVGFTCPIHNEDHSDGKPSGRIVHGGNGWRCWSCDEGGDALTLAAIVLTGSRKPPTWDPVRAWFASRGWCAPQDDRQWVPPAPIPRPAPVVVREVSRLPGSEVAELWGAAWFVDTEQRARRWMHARGLDAGACGDIVRSLPSSAGVPSWATCLGEAWSNGHTLLLPAYDAQGELVGLRARWTGAEWDGERWREVSAPGGRKEVNPRGSGVLRATVYADETGRAVLQGESPEGWSGKVIVVEGGPTWLRYAIAARKTAGEWPAVLGVWSGAWPDDAEGDKIASSLTHAAGVYVATDSDDAGDKYATAIGNTLARASITAKRIRRKVEA